MKIITLSSKNLKRFLTGAEKILTLVLIISTLIGVGALALTFQDEINVQFTYDPTLSLTLTCSDTSLNPATECLHVDLVPGTSGSSNTLSINANSNNVYGYTLSAKVGGTGQTAANSNLVNTTASTNFTSLANNASLTLANFSDNYWGYTTDTSVGSSSTYSGLQYNVDKIINVTTNSTGTAASGYPGTGSTKFTIGAKSASTQVAGDYGNTITFTVVSNVAAAGISGISDLTYMQDFATLTSGEKTAVLSSMTTGAQYTLKDSRDQKDYYISKLADGNVWMTQNLDHDIVAQANYYTPQNTDIPSAWTPSTATYATGDDTWNGSYTAPESYDPGDLCWNGIPDDDTTVSCSQSGSHYHFGNFYNWTATLAMNNSSSYTIDGTDVDQSICPAGWTLPKDGSTTGSGSSRYLVTQYGWDDGSKEMTGDYQMWDAPLYFPLSGFWYGDLSGVGSFGSYWSSVVGDSAYAYIPLYNFDGYVYPDDGGGRDSGYSVRCVAR